MNFSLHLHRWVSADHSIEPVTFCAPKSTGKTLSVVVPGPEQVLSPKFFMERDDGVYLSISLLHELSHSFVSLVTFIKYTCYVPDIVIDAGDISVNRKDIVRVLVKLRVIKQGIHM